MTEMERLAESFRRIPIVEGCLDDLQREVSVRAILTAMREPSEGAIDLGTKLTESRLIARAVWQSMLGYILNGGE